MCSCSFSCFLVVVNFFVKKLHHGCFRSSHQSCSLKKVVLRNFAKLTGKHLRQSLFLNKIADLNPATLLKWDSGTGIFL